MKVNKINISVVTAVLVSVAVMSGCGGGGGSSSESSNSSVSSVLPGSTLVTVADAYVVGATVKAQEKIFNLYVENGVYEIAEDNVTGELSASGGVNDINGDNLPTSGEPLAPHMKAPSGYQYITPFTTMLLNGVNITGESDYQAVVQFAPNYDFDVVKEGADFTNGIAQATAIAALRLSAGGDGSAPTVSGSSSSQVDNALPGTGGVSSSSVVSSISSSSSSSSSVQSNSGGILPSAIQLRGILPGSETSSSSIVSTVSSSSSSSVVSSVASSSVSSSSSLSTSSVSSASSSSANPLEIAIGLIKNAKNQEEVNSILMEYMGYFNGTYMNQSSSLSSSASESSQSSVSSNSSVIDTPDDCLPGFDCTASSSSSAVSSVTTSSSVSSSSSLSSTNEALACVEMGGVWVSEVHSCSMPVSSSSSSSVTSTSGGGVLPQ